MEARPGENALRHNNLCKASHPLLPTLPPPSPIPSPSFGAGGNLAVRECAKRLRATVDPSSPLAEVIVSRGLIAMHTAAGADSVVFFGVLLPCQNGGDYSSFLSFLFFFFFLRI